MTSHFFPLVLLPAAINVVGTTCVLVAGRHRRSLPVLATAFVFLACTFALTFWPQDVPSGHPLFSVLFTHAAIVSVVWLPGAGFAILASRTQPRSRAAFSVAALAISAVLGAAFLVITLTLVCGLLGDCL